MTRAPRCFAFVLLATLAACATAPLPAAVPSADPAAQWAPLEQGATRVIIVRHAEKAAAPAADPPLTAEGTARARVLAEVLRGANVRAIVSSQFVRTQATAAPLASASGLTVETVDARAPNHARSVAEGILARHRGETVLVVGHSNTVPVIVAALAAPQPPAICDEEYDDLYVVTVPAAGEPSVEWRRYGAVSPRGGACRR